MRNNFLFVGFGVLFLIISGCGKSQSEDRVNETTRPLIHFPYIDLTSINKKGNELIFQFTDSTPFYNEIVSKQATLVHALQKEPDSISYEKMNFRIYLPNREVPTVEYSISRADFEGFQQGFSNPLYKAFIADFLELNWKTRVNYESKYMSLLDRTNMIFAHKIEENYKNEFPNNSTWFGFDSFTVFHAYFGEVVSGNKGIAHDLVESIQGSKEYLTEEDEKELLKLIKNYESKFQK